MMTTNKKNYKTLVHAQHIATPTFVSVPLYVVCDTGLYGKKNISKKK